MFHDLDRRKFVLNSSLALAGLTPANAQAASTALVTRRLNNVMIAVSDFDRSVDFYQKLFGTASIDGDVAIIRVGGGPHFFGLTHVKNGGQPGFLSYGLTVDNFDPSGIAKSLNAMNVSCEVTNRAGTPELWIYDPDNIKIQLQQISYGHGSGPSGAILLRTSSKDSPALNLKSISHVTLTNSDGPRSLDFYTKMFHWPVQAKQAQSWCFSIGDGLDCVVFNVAANNPNAKAGINHACFTIPAFDPNTVMGILTDHGLEPIEYGNSALIRPLTCRTRFRQRANNGGGPGHRLGTAELYFNDPDNITMQIQDISYCGGSGLQGEVCP